MASKLLKLGYDGADIHWLHSFYQIGLVVTNPDTEARARQDVEDHKSMTAMTKLVDGGDKFYIDQAIEYGRVGLDYKSVQFRVKDER